MLIFILLSGISWIQDGGHLCSNHTVDIFCLLTWYICEYQYYFPVGGKWYWMVARLQGGGRLLSWLKELLSILSLNQCVCGRAWPLPLSSNVHVRAHARFILTRGRTIRSSVLDGAMWGRVHVMQMNADGLQQNGKDCNQTINQKSLNCHPPNPFSVWLPAPSLSAELPLRCLTYSYTYRSEGGWRATQ